MQVTYREEYHEFAARHGKEGEPARFANLILFPDGASCRAEDANQRAEPSEVPVERLTAIRDYHRAWISQLRKDRCHLASLGHLPRFGSPMNNLAIKIGRHKLALARAERELEAANANTREGHNQAAANAALARINHANFVASIGPLQAELKRREAEREEAIRLARLLREDGPLDPSDVRSIFPVR